MHEIPFRFDLLGLLPQCQQLQMFFLLLSRGGYAWGLITLTSGVSRPGWAPQRIESRSTSTVSKR